MRPPRGLHRVGNRRSPTALRRIRHVGRRVLRARGHRGLFAPTRKQLWRRTVMLCKSLRAVRATRTALLCWVPSLLRGRGSVRPDAAVCMWRDWTDLLRRQPLRLGRMRLGSVHGLWIARTAVLWRRMRCGLCVHRWDVQRMRYRWTRVLPGRRLRGERAVFHWNVRAVRRRARAVLSPARHGLHRACGVRAHPGRRPGLHALRTHPKCVRCGPMLCGRCVVFRGRRGTRCLLRGPGGSMHGRGGLLRNARVFGRTMRLARRALGRLSWPPAPPRAHWIMALLAIACPACSTPDREVLVSVYLNVSEADGYRLSVFRRALEAGARWHVSEPSRLYLRPGVVGLPPLRDGGALGVVVLPNEPGRHLLRRVQAPAADDVLVHAQAIHIAPNGDEQPVGPPAVAQFDRWPVTRGSLRLDLDDACLDYDALAEGPYRTCVPQVGGCPDIASVCGHFETGTFVRSACAEGLGASALADGATVDARGALSCAVIESALRPDSPDGSLRDVGPVTDGGNRSDVADAPRSDASDGSIDAGGDSGGAVVEVPAGTRRYDCAGFEECGSNGRWSRCVESSPCLAGPLDDRRWIAFDRTRSLDQPCCYVRSSEAARCTHRRASSCLRSLSCFQGTCDTCGRRNDLCCPGGSCGPGQGACNAARGICECGAVGQDCCNTNECDSGGICRTNRCIRCGGLGETCCAGSNCNAGMVCNADRCEPCGGNGQLCCAGGGCNGRLCLGGRCRTCNPGDTSPAFCSPCLHIVCGGSFEWSGCQLRPGNACDWQGGTNFQCCTPAGGGPGWQFCSSTCQWFGCASHACP